MGRERWMALAFALGAACFVVGPLPGYATRVGATADNVTTFRALSTAISNPDYDKLVWRPDALGSICFLVSAAIAYRAPPREWEAAVNLLGCILFGISAVAGHVDPLTGSAHLAIANVTTALGAACFLANALWTLRPKRMTRGPRRRVSVAP